MERNVLSNIMWINIPNNISELLEVLEESYQGHSSVFFFNIENTSKKVLCFDEGEMLSVVFRRCTLLGIIGSCTVYFRILSFLLCI